MSLVNRNLCQIAKVLEINKVDGLIIFDLDDKEIEEILCIKNSIHRKRLRNGKWLFVYVTQRLGINILRQFQDELEKRKKSDEHSEGRDLWKFF